MEDLTSFRRDLLWVISSDEYVSGGDVRELLQDYYGNPINNGQFYPNLEFLEENGLINKSKDGQKNVYSLTEKGEKKLVMRRDWERNQVDFSEL